MEDFSGKKIIKTRTLFSGCFPCSSFICNGTCAHSGGNDDGARSQNTLDRLPKSHPCISHDSGYGLHLQHCGRYSDWKHLLRAVVCLYRQGEGHIHRNVDSVRPVHSQICAVVIRLLRKPILHRCRVGISSRERLQSCS